jgi:DNA helicase-2/ATP-dependent DNA helicase PcrA
VTTFVSGDDDQSIYSFRFASPHGIQLFDRDYPGAGDHNLVDCFRCTPAVLAGATTLMAAHPLPDRIPKHLRSLYEASDPPQTGVLHRLRFASGRAEARAVAASCQALIRSGIPPREILILISDRRALATELTNAFEEIGLDHDPPHPAAYVDTDHGRLALAILRIVSEPNDYVAHRIVLGQARGVGAGTCNAIANAVVANNLNYRSLFYDPLPAELFRGRQKTALESARALVARVVGWEPSDELATHDAEIRQMLEDRSGAEARDSWIENASHLPPDLTLGEVRDYLWADTDEQQLDVLRTAFQRLGLELIEDDVLLPRARMMTMHRAKGLSAQVVFIPGLEEEIFPGERRRPYPGLVLEAARLLYVSVSRARGASIVSYAGTRTRFGILTRPAPSRFTASLGGAFGYRDDQGLLPAEVQVIVGECASL